MSVICFIIIFLVYFILILRKRTGNWLAISLVGLYCISAIASYFIYKSEVNQYRDVNLASYLFFTLLAIISFYPITNYKPKKYIAIENMNLLLANSIALFLIILFSMGLINSVYSIVTNFHSLLIDFSYANDLYADNRDVTLEQTGSSLEHIGSVLQGMFSEVLVLFTFYYMTLKRNNRIILVLLCFSLLYPFLSSFVRGSRTVMVWWFMEMLISYLIFKDYYTGRARRWLKFGISLASIIAVIIFSILTIGRFSINSFSTYDNAGESVIAYLGQGTLNYSDMVLQNDVHQYGDNCFPLFRNIIGLESSSNLYERQNKWESRMRIKQGVFYTYLGDLCNDFGPIITLIIVSLISIMFNLGINRNRKTLSLEQIVLLYFICCISFNGVFYFSYKSVGGNLRIILYIIILLMIGFLRIGSKKSINNG